MAKRINQLTDAAQDIARDLEQRCGTLKVALSAGILSLNALTPRDREFFISLANGLETDEKRRPNLIDDLIAQVAQISQDRDALASHVEDLEHRLGIVEALGSYQGKKKTKPASRQAK